MSRFQRTVGLRRGRVGLLVAALAIALVGGRGVSGAIAGGEAVVAPHWSLPRPDRVIALGDASCWPIQRTDVTCRMDEVAPLAERSDLLLFLGDIAQDAGRVDEYQQGFDATWGHLVGRSFPVAGNHDYGTPGGGPYHAYFGERAGQPGLGFYSVDLSGWRIYALNSNCEQVGCGPGSAQWRWLQSLLRTNPACSLAMLHHPVRSSVSWFDRAQVAPLEPLYELLIDAGVPLVLSGHAHLYERVSLSDRTDLIIAGTGGFGFHDLAPGTRIAGSRAAIEHVFGVLELELSDGSYSSAFLPVDGGRRDAHSRPCADSAEADRN